jgi:hypothetical protein
VNTTRDPFCWWYSLTEVARRTGKSPRTIRRAMASGQFGPPPGQADSMMRHICGEWMFPWPAVARFLNVPVGETADSHAWRARSEGELRRKVAADLSAPEVVQTSGRDGGEP